MMRDEGAARAGLPLRTVAFWLLVAGLAVCHAVIIWHSLTARFWEDEALNLTVPLNLLDGLGYSSDGALSGSQIAPFDTRISTGPTVLLPVAGVLALGVDPVIGGRLVPVAFWLLLTAGLAVLGGRLVGRWAALFAAAAPLTFNGLGSISPIQGPADLLGEIPAAALLVWALVALPRRGWLAGLLVGLAVQAKLIALLALPAFAVALWVLAPGRGGARWIALLKKSWLPLLMAGVPTLLFELAALAAFGPAGFADHLRALRDFVRGGGQNMQPTTVPQKLETLAGAWFVPVAVVVMVVLVTVGLIVTGLIVTRSDDDSRVRDARMLAAAGVVGAATFIGWWVTAAHLPLWVRHPAAGVLAFVPVLAIVAFWGARTLWVRDGTSRVVGMIGMLVLVASVVWSVTGHIAQTFQPRSETLATQRQAVAPIAQWLEQNDVEWVSARPWGAAVAPIVMSGAHVGLFDAPSMADAPQLTGQKCVGAEILKSERFRLCAAP